jgi:hypothetical protein
MSLIMSDVCVSVWLLFWSGFCLQARLHEENERCLLYLDASTRKALIATSEKQLLDRHTAGMLDKVRFVLTVYCGYSFVLLITFWCGWVVLCNLLPCLVQSEIMCTVSDLCLFLIMKATLMLKPFDEDHVIHAAWSGESSRISKWSNL